MIPTDKLIHCVGSLFCCLLLAQYFPIMVAAGITFGLGLAKEFVNDLWLKRGAFEWTDLLADGIGVVLAVIIGGV